MGEPIKVGAGLPDGVWGCLGCGGSRRREEFGVFRRGTESVESGMVQFDVCDGQYHQRTNGCMQDADSFHICCDCVLSGY